MRRIRSRLTILILLLLIFTSLLSVVLYTLYRNGVIFHQAEGERVLIFGIAVKDLVLLIVALGMVGFFINFTSRSTTDPIRDLSRATREIAAGNYDVTVSIKDQVEELEELERNFNRMTAELRSNEYLQKDFISNVSHQLKTPLSILSGYAQLLEEPDLPQAERAEYSQYVARESQRLVGLIDDMLRLSRIDHREIQPRAQRFALGEQLRQVILELEPTWSRAGLELRAEIQDMDYTGDAELLRQVWMNLLENAVKFTPPGGEVSVTLRKTPEGAQVAVEDTGIGIAPEELERIFEQFYQGDTPFRSQGSGLGLSLCRKIVELHGGTVTARSREGRGSIFTVFLPVKE